MRVSVLGPLVVGDGVSLSPRDRVVLTALAMQPGEVVEGERLADALWGDDVPASWNKVVQGCIVRLRKCLGPDSIETHAHGYRLSIAPDDLDVRRFELSLRRARELLVLGEPERVMFAADEALALWRGRPLPDAGEWEPARIEAERLQELRMEAEELQLDAALRAGRHAEVLATARACVDAAPTRERRWELLALAQYRAGRQADALRTLRAARRTLVDEVGVDPGPDLVALERAVLEQDPALIGVEPPRGSVSWCPWPGLLAYDIDDAEGFFGREEEVDTCLARLAADGAVVVVGASGTGKSSLARAGIAARLRRNGRTVGIIVPGARPLDALTAVPASREPPLLVVDQCEEVVTLCRDPQEQSAFLDALVEHAATSPLLVTLRADRLTDLSSHAGFAALVEQGLFLLGPMSEADLRATVEGPAARAGLHLEPGLVDLVVREVQSEPGALPLLSHALHQTWTRREGRTMTVAAFQDSGGIAGAIAQSAERVYTESPADERTKLRELLVRLVAPTDHGDPVRVRLSRDVVAGDPGYERVIERLVAARLLTSDGQAVELAHEAVARAWPRLREWLDEDVEGMRLLQHLTATAAGWDAMGRPASELYRGPRLAQARSWQERTASELTAVERSFLDSSIEVEEAELREAQEQVRHERRTNQRLRRLVVAASILTVLAIAVSSVAFRERQRANDGADIAEARRIAAQALVARPHDRALLLAVEAIRRWDSPETQGNLLSTIGRSPTLTRIIGGTDDDDDALLDLELSADGALAAVSLDSGELRVYDLERGAEVASFSQEGTSYDSPSFSPDGGAVAVVELEHRCFDVACPGYDVLVFDVERPKDRPTVYRGATGQAGDLAWSAASDLIATVPAADARPGEDGSVIVWRADDPSRPHGRMSVPRSGDGSTGDDTPGWLAFSPDGSHLYASTAGRTVELDLESGAIVRELPGRGGLALSEDGEALAVRGDDGVEVVSTGTGRTTAHLSGEDAGVVAAAAFLGEDRHLAIARTDGSIVVRDWFTGTLLQTLEGHTGGVTDAVYADGRGRLYSIGGDRTIFEWDPLGSPLSRTLVTGSRNPFDYVLVSPRADSALVRDSALRRIDVRSGEVSALEGMARSGPGGTLNSAGPILPAGAAYSPDGRQVVGVSPYGATRLWDAHTGELIASREGRGSENYGAVAVRPDTGAIVVADIDGRVVELDGRTLEPTGRSLDVDDEPLRIHASRDGKVAIIGTDFAETTIVFGDLDEGEITASAHLDTFALSGSFSPDGQRYAFGTDHGNIGVIDAATATVTGPSTAAHAGPVASVTFSPDGETLATFGFDGELVLADTDGARPRARSSPRGVGLGGDISYAPDGKTILITYTDGAIVEYEVDPAAWIDHACRVTGRDLSSSEWRDAFGSGTPHRTCVDR